MVVLMEEWPSCCCKKANGSILFLSLVRCKGKR